jgi:hypothetical protein
MAHKNPESRRVHEEAREQAQDLDAFDYSAPAELFAMDAKRPKGRVMYKRFGTAAEALRFAIEEMAPRSLGGAYLQVDEARFGAQEIQYLYANAGYPLRSIAADG